MIVSNISFVIIVPFLTITSLPTLISWAILLLTSLSKTFNFLLNLYLPTLPKSYLNLSKNLTINWFLAESNVAGSPGLNFSYISIKASSVFLVESLSIVFFKYSLLSNKSNISLSLDKPKALSKVVRGTFLVLSILTYNTSFASVSYSSQVPLVGIIFEANTGLPFLSISLEK